MAGCLKLPVIVIGELSAYGIQKLVILASCLEDHDGTCNRWVTVETESRLGVPLQPEEARQLAGASIAAADESEDRR